MSARILSAGVIVLLWRQDHYDYLLLRAYNYWDFPKGMVELGETPLEGALREVTEETTISDLKFRWGKSYRETQPYNNGNKIARYYVAETFTRAVELPINPELGRPEHSEYCWTTRERAWDMLTPRVQAILKWSDEIINKPRRRHPWQVARSARGPGHRPRRPPSY